MPRHIPMLALLAALALPNCGCAVLMLGMGHEGGSGTLSDAASQASPDSMTRSKTPPPPPDVGYTVPPTVGPFAPSEPSADPAPVPDAMAGVAPGTEAGHVEVRPTAGPARYKTHRLFGGVVFGGGALGGREYDGFTAGGLSIGGYPEPRLRVDAAVTFNSIAFREQAYLHEAFREPGEFNLDVAVRFYLTKDKTFMGVYPLAGLGTGTLLWEYARPVTVIEDGVEKQLETDDINYFSLFGGAGMSLLQTRYVHVGGNLVGGVRFYGWHTGSGLRNDMLRTTGYVKLLFEVCFRVAKV